MKKSLGFVAAIALLATPAIAQIRPDACAPVFPLLDKVAAAPVPQDVTVAQAAPTAGAKKGFFGLPLLLLAALGAGGAAALGSNGSGSSTVSPA
jgi:hypothetical protein